MSISINPQNLPVFENAVEMMSAFRRAFGRELKPDFIAEWYVALNNFDFDFLVLVNLDENYRPTGIWKLSVARAQEILVYREKFRKYQSTQDNVKKHAEKIR